MKEKNKNVRDSGKPDTLEICPGDNTSKTTCYTIPPGYIFNLPLYLEKQPPFIHLNLQSGPPRLIILVLSVLISRSGVTGTYKCQLNE